MTVDERMRPAAELKPEVASLNMGSMNFALFPMLARFQDFKHDWERAHLEGSRDLVFKNTFQDIEKILGACRENATRFEFECYDIAHLYNLAHFLDRGLVEPPLFVQSVFGILGGIGTHPEDLMHMRRTADRLFGDDYRWSILGAGRNQISLATIGAAMGANVRVGGYLGRVQRPAGHQDPPGAGRPIAGGGEPGRGPRHARPQGRRSGRFLGSACAALESFCPPLCSTLPE